MTERIERVMRGWDAIDDHRTGSPGDTRTAEWLAAEIEAAGAVAELEPFRFDRRVPVDPHLMLEAMRIEGLPCFDAPGTPAAGITGQLTPLGGPGEIGLLTFEPAGPGAGALLAARRDTHHQALVAVHAGEQIAPGLAVINADAYGAPYDPPVLQVGTEHRTVLESAAATGKAVRMRAAFEETTVEASNVGTRVPGQDPALPPLVVMTPRSGWWQCTSERGGGLAAWLAILDHFLATPPARTVLFTANTGHELGHAGLEHYLEAHPTLVRDAHCWLHLGANFAAAGGAVLYQASDQGLLDLGQEVLSAAGLPPEVTTPVGQRPLGEARNIFDGGGRYVSLLGSNPLFHHPDDRWPNAVNADKTARLVTALVGVSASIADVG